MKNKVLIVDDDPRNIFALQAVLKSRGLEVSSAASAEDGIEQMKSDRGIKIVLLDMMMPDMDGYEALAQIRGDKNLSATPVIAVTAQAMKGDREKCLQAGANGYISKPVDVDRLFKLMEEVKMPDENDQG